MPLLLQAEPMPPRAAEMAYVRPAGPADLRPVVRVARPTPCPLTEDGDIVVCARRDDEQYRLRPLAPPPPAARNFLHKPLRVTLAPGLTFGLQPGGGIGLHSQFGPGARGTDKPK